MAPRKIIIDITHDTMCPWCYIGYKHIKAAMTQFAKEKGPSIEFEVQFHPFALDPTLPLSPGVAKRDWLAEHLGPARAKQAEEQMRILGFSEGILFCHDGQVSNTLDSHRVIEKALRVGGQEAQLKVAEALFHAHFERACDLGSADILANEVSGAGVMAHEEVMSFIASEELKGEMQKGIREAKMRGISGVPYITVNKKLVLVGAQPTTSFYKIFVEIANGEHDNMNQICASHEL
ncbi:thioredoxin-like protein [Mycena floridula]|nr:thioredoxin-like protein [Mycena floridula]